MHKAAVPRMVTTVARSFVAAAAFAYVFDLLRQTHDHLTNGTGRTFGDDFINYWSGGFLALHGRAMEVYSYTGFHAFEQSVAGPATGPYHYSYPPVMLLLAMPFALLPYVPALFVWLATSWYAFYRALLLAMNMGATLFRLTVDECIAAVTREAARALGRFEDIGSLERGKYCDLAIWNIERPAELVYRIGFNPPHARVWHGDSHAVAAGLL